ncbi:MAG TPA: tetratricopeptide repeat protein, partial [Polyangiaceae bacterium]
MAATPEEQALFTNVENEIAGARYTAALALLNRHASDSITTSHLRAKALYGLERFGAAMNELQSLLEKKLDPVTHVRVRMTKLKLMGVMARTEEAVSYALDVANEANAEGMIAEAVEAHTEAAWQYGRMRCQPIAEDELGIARKMAANHPKAAILNADIDLIDAFVAMQFDDRPKAMTIYLRAAQVQGDTPEVGRIRRAAHIGIARIHYLLGEFDQAHRALDAIRPFAESDVRSRRMVIQVLAAQKRWAEAAVVYGELRAASPKSENAESDELDRALAFYRAGNFDEAVTGFAKVVADADDFKDERVADARTTLKNLSRPGARDMKRKRLYAFPSVAQLRNHCGPASCELYLRFFGITAEQIEIARAIKFPDGGTPVYRMRQYLEQAGFVARRIEAELPRLRALLDRDIPVILEEDYSASRHVAVAIGYDDARGILEVQDPMTHAVRETTYEELAKIQAFSNAGALVGVPRSRPDLIQALDQAGALDCEYISLVDRAWAFYDEEKYEQGDLFVQNSLSIRRDYELAWIYQFQRAMKDVEKNASAETRVRLHRVVAEAEAIWPNEEWPQTLRGDVAYEEDRYGEALSAFERARDRDPDDPSNWSKIADCQLALGNIDAAKSALLSCLARDPAHPRGTENLSYIYADQGEFGRASMLNEVALTKRPKNPFNWGVKRTINLGRRRYEQAVKDWEKI